MVADMVNNDPDTSSLLKVVFVHNYNCSWAEKLIPAADVSEQISTAGTEASGTGNMKLMLNGAVTLGTYDGANVEITEQAGRENEYIFGATVEEINALKKNGYDPRAIYKADKEIARVLDTMVDGTFPDPDGAIKELVSSLLLGASWHKPDHYFILHDFHSYVDAKLAVNRDYRDELVLRAQVPDEHRQRRHVLLRPHDCAVREGDLEGLSSSFPIKTALRVQTAGFFDVLVLGKFHTISRWIWK